ncbi:hypothetical protein Q0601_14975 [Paracoccus onubensis]|uniref:hypothetical protein n=1 Tax=Paracoccus onubensis TaxID=1675788 RepID=UPI002730F5AC|nr:hypothetical protein [Paracoccus onubensis]MDP0928487.1 hypothetical protein [Paracoccus onubensis]
MTYASFEEHASAAKTNGFFAALFNALRAGITVRSGRKPANTGPLHFHGSPRVF